MRLHSGDKDGVELTNNSAERTLRCAVQWGKTSFGSRSTNSEVTLARVLTVTQPRRIQNHNPLPRINRAMPSQHLAQHAPSRLKNSAPS